MPNYKTTLWADLETLPRFPSLAADVEVDVAIVGAGITGVTAALLLTRAGSKVALLESRRIGSGETGKTTAHLTEVLDLRFRRLISKFGQSGAALAVRGHRAAIQQIATFVRELGIDCDFEAQRGYLFAETKEDARELDGEAEAARRLGLEPRELTQTPLPFPIAAALCFEDQAQIHPRAYLDGLVAALAREGAQIFETTHVEDITDGEPCQVKTAAGIVRARHVIVASGVPISDRYLVHPKLAAYRSYAVAVSNVPNAPAGLFWDVKDPYHYLRSHTVGGVRHLVVGGEDHKVGEHDDTTVPFQRLDAYVQSHFGRAAAATDHRWSGQIIEPADGLPYVGRDALARHVFIATGYSGNGITGGTLAARVLANQVHGTDDDWTELLDATRTKPFAAAAALVSENIDFPKHLARDHLLPLAKRDLASIAPHDGAVLSVSGTKLAVYRDGQGNLTALSPVCPHLGCFVHWNTAEKSWDCPCHGSRFSPTGRVLNGPATSNLEERPLPKEDGERT